MAKLESIPASAGHSDVIDVLDRDGVVVLKGFVANEWLATFNREVQPFIDSYRQYRFDNDDIDGFLGSETVRLHGLAAKAPSFVDLMLDSRLLALMDHYLLPNCSSYLLSAGELIEICSGETAQPLHLDDESWPPQARRGGTLLDVNAMIAASDFTAANGATLVVPGSHAWPRDRVAKDGEIVQAVMRAGDAAIIRGDTLHAGGTNADGTPRRAVSVAYCLGWLRPVENSFLNVPIEIVKTLPERAREPLGYEIHDGLDVDSGFLGYYEMGSPTALFDA